MSNLRYFRPASSSSNFDYIEVHAASYYGNIQKISLNKKECKSTNASGQVAYEHDYIVREIERQWSWHGNGSTGPGYALGIRNLNI